MAVVDTINSIKENIADAYGIAEEKGATIPENKNIENLADCISSIEGGGSDPYEYFIEEVKESDIAASNRWAGFYDKKIPAIKMSGTDFSYRFDYSYAEEIDTSLFDTSRVTTFYYMFGHNPRLKSLDLSSFNTTSAKTFSYMFYQCTGLQDLDLSSFDMSNAIALTSMFASCSSLKNLKFGYNLGKGYTEKKSSNANYTCYVQSTYLTHESLISMINGLYDLNLTYGVAEGGTLYTQKFQIGPTNKNKLTEDERQMVVDKGWVIS